MLIASILLMGSIVRNPALPNPGRPTPVPAEARGVYAITRHPMMWAFALWGMCHIAVYTVAANIIVAVAIISGAGRRGVPGPQEGDTPAGYMARLGGEDELLAVLGNRHGEGTTLRVRHARAGRRLSGVARCNLRAHSTRRLASRRLALVLG